MTHQKTAVKCFADMPGMIDAFQPPEDRGRGSWAIYFVPCLCEIRPSLVFQISGNLIRGHMVSQDEARRHPSGVCRLVWCACPRCQQKRTGPPTTPIEGDTEDDVG